MKDSVKYNVQTALMESERTKPHGEKKHRIYFSPCFSSGADSFLPQRPKNVEHSF